MLPGFDDPATASIPPAENVYFSADQAVAAKDPGRVTAGAYGTAYGTTSGAGNLQTSPLMFGSEKVTSQGEAVVDASKSSRGHWSEIFNFHGSPAPWILIGLLLAAGLLHLSAKTHVGFEGAL